MKLTYLGTAAAEGWPALFCNCENCKEAARRGGKHIRTRSQAIIDDDFLLDLPPDTYHHKLMSGLDFSAVKYLFITHWHMDHFYPQELTVRGSYYSHNMVSPALEIYCAAETKELFDRVAWEANKDTLDSLHFHLLTAFAPVQAGAYTITPLPANHMHEVPDSHPFIYLIEKDGKRILYGHDTGIFLPEVWDYLKNLAEKGRTLHLVSLDGTSGRFENGEKNGHMGLPDNRKVKARLLKTGLCNSQTVFVLNHFSHNGGILYDELVSETKNDGFLISYDGMSQEI